MFFLSFWIITIEKGRNAPKSLRNFYKLSNFGFRFICIVLAFLAGFFPLTKVNYQMVAPSAFCSAYLTISCHTILLFL